MAAARALAPECMPSNRRRGRSDARFLDAGARLHIPLVEPGTLGPCPVAPDALQGIKRQQTNPARWSGPNWKEFSSAVRARGIEVLETAAARAAFATDAGGTAYRSEERRVGKECRSRWS